MADKKDISRRKFLGWMLGGAGALGLGSWWAWRNLGKETKGVFPGEIKGANSKWGHLIREGLQVKPTKTVKVPHLIVGGGMAGLSAGWKLKQSGQEDFLLLEMNTEVGGNAISGSHGPHAYPWGAHYMPLPNPGNTELLQLLEDLGCITGWENGLPIYNELYLCHDPEERLLFHGVWQEGLVPKARPGSAAATEMERFFTLIQQLRSEQSAAGAYAFDIPLDRSDFQSAYAEWDGISMKKWLAREGYTSEELTWYLDYCCRDDFGGTLETTSAWAGLHYFAARRGRAANAEQNSVLTWPRGNGWLVQQLQAQLSPQIQSETLVLSVENTPEGIRAVGYHPPTKTATEYLAEKAVVCVPRFVAQHMVRDLPVPAKDFVYAPWLVANVELRKRPAGPGQALSWDNVAFGRKSLGYVVSNHQSMDRTAGPVVITFYEALADEAPAEVRRWALETDCATWQQRILPELEWMHPGIREEIARFDVYVWGHGMISPRPGFITGETRKRAAQPLGNIHFAHTDLSGISIFEEAFAQGLRAAKEMLPQEELG